MIVSFDWYTKNDFQPIFSICIDMLNSLIVVMMCGVDLNIFAYIYI